MKTDDNYDDTYKCTFGNTPTFKVKRTFMDSHLEDPETDSLPNWNILPRVVKTFHQYGKVQRWSWRTQSNIFIMCILWVIWIMFFSEPEPLNEIMIFLRCSLGHRTGIYRTFQDSEFQRYSIRYRFSTKFYYVDYWFWVGLTIYKGWIFLVTEALDSSTSLFKTVLSLV